MRYLLGLALAFGGLASGPGLTIRPSSRQPETITWTRVSEMPLPRGGYYAAWHGGGLLIAGGTYWREKKKYWTDRVSFYHPVARKWSEWPRLPRPLAYGAMAEAAGSLYLIGGADQQASYRDVYRLSGRNWVRVGEAPSTLLYGAAAASGSKIYVLGGGRSVEDLTTATNEAWSFDVRSGRWESLSPVPGPPRVIHTAAAEAEAVYVFGGSTQSPGRPLVNLDDAYRLDLPSGRWRAVAPAPVAARAWWATAAADGIYLFGGYSDRFLDTVYRYDPRRDEYRLVARLPLPLADTEFFFHGGRFYAAGGEDAAGSRFTGTLEGTLRGR